MTGILASSNYDRPLSVPVLDAVLQSRSFVWWSRNRNLKTVTAPDPSKQKGIKNWKNTGTENVANLNK